ncbi:MAG: type II CAAX prenyl endopeptidase Rce1 family protein [Acidobacteriota bacterium]
MDVLAFVLALELYIWVGQPFLVEYRTVQSVVIAGLLAIAVSGTFWHRRNRRQLGLRLDNFFHALVLYGAASLAYAGLVLLWWRGGIQVREPPWPRADEIARYLVWAFLQEFCLLAFLLTRLRQILRRDRLAIAACALLFALFHLPNPFLTFYTLGGGAIVASLFHRQPNLFAAALAHATASVLVIWLLPHGITGGMRVGWLYPGS